MPLTRRDFLATSVLGTAAGALAKSPIVRAWQQTPPPVTPVFTAIRNDVGFFTGRGGTIGYLINAGGVAVVDTQFRDSAKLLLDGLNERSKNRLVDRVINTHHHGDHTDGNIVFKGIAKKVVAHQRAAEHMKAPPGRPEPTTEQLYPDTTFSDTWREQVGTEWIRAQFSGPAHTSGDVVVTFERANVAHMGDLMFKGRHPIIDRAAGASIKNWITVLEKAVAAHANDTVYIFGHSGANQPVTGPRADVTRLRDYFTALLDFVRAEMKAGKTKEQILALRDPLKGFEDFGPFAMQDARAPLTVAYEEIEAGKVF
jgi:glyoxylase-like metal-dependent hydrolase (beta-lactamase superfamily II)